MTCAYKPGDILKERYLIQEIIGTGAMGEVYRAVHVTLHKDVAIKLMHVHIAEKSQSYARFRREAKAAGKLDHPHICQVTDFDTTEQGDFYIVMEYLRGETLRERLDKQGTLELRSIFRIMHDLLCALECAHGSGIVHRDIKPGNIMLKNREDRDDFVKLIDFGIVHVDEPDDSHGTLTQSGQIYGTPQYLAPEQVMGDRVDFRADLYACGCMLFEMLEGAPPFNADNYIVLLNKHLILQPPHLTTQVACAQQLDEVIQKLLQKNPLDRFGSARELRETLDQIEETLTPAERMGKKDASLPGVTAKEVITLPSAVTIDAKAVKTPETDAEIISGAEQVARLHQLAQEEQKKNELEKSQNALTVPRSDSSHAETDGEKQKTHDEAPAKPRVSAVAVARGIVITLLAVALVNMFWQQKQLQSKLAHERDVVATDNLNETDNQISDTNNRFVLSDERIQKYAKTECRIASDHQLSGDESVRIAAESCLLGNYEEAYTLFDKVKTNYHENIHFDIMMAIDTYAVQKYDEVTDIIVKLFQIDPATVCDDAVRDIIYSFIEDEEIYDKLQTKLKRLDSKNVAEGVAWLLLLSPCNRYQNRFTKLSEFYDSVDDSLELDWLSKAVQVWRPFRTKGECGDRQKYVDEIITNELSGVCTDVVDNGQEKTHSARCSVCFPFIKERGKS